MDLSQTLWNSKTNGRKKMILLLSCLALLVVSIVLMIVGFNGDNETLAIAATILTCVAIVITVVVLILGKFTGLKWNVSDLLFAVAESGLYFTGVVNQNSYFFAEWSEISGYTVKQGNNNLATVTVYFSAPTDSGSFGRITSLKMVNVAGLDTLRSVFQTYNIAERPAK